MNLKNDFASGKTITIDGDSRGDINISGDANGDITLNSDLRGDIDIVEDASGDITIDDTLQSTGRIMVGGLLDGGLSVGKETVALSPITAEDGLGSNGCIQINTKLGLYDANGDMLFGPATIPDPINDITFDGGIKIWDQAFGANGDLEGDITITGCQVLPLDEFRNHRVTSESSDFHDHSRTVLSSPEVIQVWVRLLYTTAWTSPA